MWHLLIEEDGGRSLYVRPLLRGNYLNLFCMSFNPGINPGIYNINPEIPGMDNDPGIAIPKSESVVIKVVVNSSKSVVVLIEIVV